MVRGRRNNSVIAQRQVTGDTEGCLLYTSPSPRDLGVLALPVVIITSDAEIISQGRQVGIRQGHDGLSLPQSPEQKSGSADYAKTTNRLGTIEIYSTSDSRTGRTTWVPATAS